MQSFLIIKIEILSRSVQSVLKNENLIINCNQKHYPKNECNLP